jgi:phenylpyruvate tautomerase PptA (4-oxalocrotonate tautomerase family)
MPYLQLDVPTRYGTEQKQRIAKRFGEIYADIMQANVRRISVAIRELTEGGIWRCTEDEPYEAALLMCDIRRGRPPEQRERLAKALVEACSDILSLRADQVNVEFTQHSGDEMFHPLLGRLSKNWAADESR